MWLFIVYTDKETGMKNALAFALLFALPSVVLAECGVELSHGKITLHGIPTKRGDDLLTTKYTRVETRLDTTSSVSELSFECEFGNGYALSASHLFGLEVSADRDVYFTGYEGRGIKIPPGFIVTVHEHVRASANRISGLKYFDFGNVAPYVRLGVEDVRASHRVWVTWRDYTLAREESERKIASYFGLGVAISRKKTFMLRAEWQMLAMKPRQVSLWMIGIHGQF
jgi:hypothetical protein